MIIKRITIKRFKAIKEKTIEFSPGLNIIKGSDNEIGKSSVRLAIVKALYQDPTTKSEEIRDLTRWGEEKPWEIELEIESDSKLFKITKKLEDKFCELRDLNSSEVITNKNALANKVAELTGCPSEPFFESTACIGQEELIRLLPETLTKDECQTTKGIITKRLQTLLTSAEGVDVPTITSKLYEKTHRKDAKGPYSRLQEISNQIATLERDRKILKEKVEKVIESRKELNKVKEELHQMDKDLPSKQNLVEKNKRILELEKEINNEKSRYSNFERAKELKSNLEKQIEELEKFAYFEGAERKIEELKTSKSKSENLKKQKDILKKEEESILKHKPTSWLFLVGCVLIIVGLMISLIASIYLGIGIIIGGLIFMIYWFISRKIWKERLKLNTKAIKELETQIQNEEKNIQEILKDFKLNEYNQCLEKFQEFNNIKNKKRTTEDMLKGIMGEKDWDKFKKEYEDLAIRITAAEKELESLRPFKLEPFKLQKLESEVNQLQMRKEELKEKEGGLVRFLEYTDVDTEQLSSMEEELKELEEKKVFTKRK